MSKLDDVTQKLVQVTTERERRLTPRRLRFIAEVIKDPGRPTAAAVRAGYSPRSAKVTASRLMSDPVVQHELAKHFIAQEKLVSEALTETLLRLRSIVQSGSDKAFLGAAKLLIAYTKLAVPILGLDIKKAAKEEPAMLEAPLEEVISETEKELERLRKLGDRNEPSSTYS